jgi:arginyl-tRNA synthetase
MDAFSDAKNQAAGLLVEACKSAGYEVSLDDAIAKFELPKEEFGDLASPIAFDLAKKAKKPPRKIAEEINEKLGESELFEKTEVAGAGYINLYLNSAKFAETVLTSIDEDYGKSELGKGRKALVESPGVNPNKPWHIGHMRNALLGDSVARLLEFAGFQVQRIDYIDDLGLQVAQSVWGFLNLSNKSEGKVDHWLGAQYVEVAKKIEDEKIKEEVRALVKDLEEGTSENAKLGRELALKCVLAQYETGFKLNVFQDVMVWESDIVREKLLDSAMKKALDSGAVVKEKEGKNAGCIVAKLEELEEFKGMESADKVLVRSDGTAVYTGKDLAFQLWKFGLIPSNFKFKKLTKQLDGRELYSTATEGEAKEFGKADLVLNVIGVEQTYPQQVLKMILKLLGYEKQAENSVHLSYEHAALPEAKFSGRKGTWKGFTADELIDETTKEA